MRKQFSKFALSAAFGLALTFTFSGCAYHSGEPIGTVYQVGGPVKDVEVIGMIHVKCNEGKLGIPSNLTSPYGYGQAINSTPK